MFKSKKRRRVTIDCSKDEPITEQSHASEVDINNIVRRHGGNLELIAKTAQLQGYEFQFDDVTSNDFQEAMEKVAKATQTFESLPSALRKQFDNSAAQFLDFIHDPANSDQLVEMGLATARPKPDTSPVEVVIKNPETPPEPA